MCLCLFFREHAMYAYEPILPRNGEWGGKREVWIVGVPTVTLWSSGVHIWSNIPNNKCIDAFEHSQNYMRLVCACKATLFPLNVWGKEEENMHAHPYVKVSRNCGVFSANSSI